MAFHSLSACSVFGSFFSLLSSYSTLCPFYLPIYSLFFSLLYFLSPKVSHMPFPLLEMFLLTLFISVTPTHFLNIYSSTTPLGSEGDFYDLYDYYYSTTDSYFNLPLPLAITALLMCLNNYLIYMSSLQNCDFNESRSFVFYILF